MKTTKYALALALGLIALVAPRTVLADTEIRVMNAAGGGDTGWIACGGTSCAFVGGVGNYSLTANIAIQINAGNPLLDLNYDANTSVVNAGTLVFEAMAGDYTFDFSGTTLLGNGNSTLGDTISFSDYGGNNNTVCATGFNACDPSTSSTPLTSIGPIADSSYGASGTGAGNSANPYSLGIIVNLDSPTSAGTGSGDIALDSGALSVPEPTTIWLLSTGLLGLMGMGWRKRRLA
jgi:hypothetical protein